MSIKHTAARTLLAFTLAVGIALAPLTTTFASNQGTLSSSSKLQKYDSSIRDGLADYLTLYGPIVTKDNIVYAMGVKEDGILRILKFDANKQLVKTFLPPAEYDISPIGATSDSHGNVYFVADKSTNDHNDRGQVILKYSPSDEFLGPINTNDIDPNKQISSIYSMAVATNDTLYVTVTFRDQDNISLIKMNQSGEIISQADQLSGSTGAYNRPLLVALNSKDELYAGALKENDYSEFQTMKLFRINEGGQVTSTIDNGRVIGVGYSMTLDHNDNLYFMSIGDSTTSPQPGCPMYFELRKYDSHGTFIDIIDTSAAVSEGPVCSIYGGSGTPPFATNLNIDSDGDLYIGTGDYEYGTPGKARIAIYKTPKNVATFPSVSGGQDSAPKVELTLPENVNLVQASIKKTEEISMPPNATFSYPLGLINFTAKVKDTQPLPVELYFITDLSPSDVTPMKYANGLHTPIKDASVTESTLNGKRALKLTYTVVDGGELDEDGVVNGEIVDPVGLAVSSSSVPVPLAPNTGAGPTIPLSAILLIGGVLGVSVPTAYRALHSRRTR